MTHACDEDIDKLKSYNTPLTFEDKSEVFSGKFAVFIDCFTITFVLSWFSFFVTQ